MQTAEDATRAAAELVSRLGRGGSLVYLQERLERLASAGDWSGHDAAARVLTALERAIAADGEAT
jgi:hypothetical protein